MYRPVVTEVIQYRYNMFYRDVHHRDSTEMFFSIVAEVLDSDLLLYHYRDVTEVLQ